MSWIAPEQTAIDYVRVERSEIEETGEYDLEGLFVRLGYAIITLGPKRVVLDTIEVLFSGLSNAAVLRSEIRRLFRWLKVDKDVTAIVDGRCWRRIVDSLWPGRICVRLCGSCWIIG